MGEVFKDVVIFLPGIGGSNLVRGDQAVWQGSWQAAISALGKGGLDDLILSTDSPDSDDGISAKGLLGTFHIIPGLWKIEGYHGFCQQLCATVGLAAGKNFFAFSYDWRRDNRLSAKRLAEFASDKIRKWRSATGNESARIILIGHSMGGLVARYYVECLGGWQDVARLYTLGTPHRGSLNALGFLANGFAKGVGPLSVDATAPLRSFPSVYQLLPTYPCIATGSQMQRVSESELAALDPVAIANAMAFHQEIQDAVTTSSHLAGYPHGYIIPIAAVRQATFQSAKLDSGKLTLLNDFAGDDHGGDGTVPRVSAVPQEMKQDQAFNVWGHHSALCSSSSVEEHIIATLRARRIDEDKFRFEDKMPEIRFNLDDVYQANQPIYIRATVEGVREQSLKVTTTFEDETNGPSSTLHRAGDFLEGEIVLPAGAWKLKLSGKKSLVVSDLIIVM